MPLQQSNNALNQQSRAPKAMMKRDIILKPPLKPHPPKLRLRPPLKLPLGLPLLSKPFSRKRLCLGFSFRRPPRGV